jgi:hypothetical protein
MLSKLKPISMFISVSGVLENQLTLAKISYNIASFSHRQRSLASDYIRDLPRQLHRYRHVVRMSFRKLHLRERGRILRSRFLLRHVVDTQFLITSLPSGRQ